ncbi:hypothetical protein [Alloactinosynnema sp. L-07]|uniref:hypothetical protein n=1 Tax=Alloactinosynnema sp. L-07 TaxID=1653480 RepID=UPI00065EFEF6|nr:hypothetical protein [Alloactinosynnema sp. L-07]CRK60013.1 hypothetical protein [Alloactinosynnema sp. L-07]
MDTTRPVLSIVTVLAVLGSAVTACSTAPEAQLPAMPPGSTRPFDLFRGDHIALINDAQIKLQSECMVGKGYSQFAQLVNVRTDGEFGFNEDPFAPRTEEQAQRYGLGKPRPASPPRVSGKGDGAYNASIDHCEETAWKAVVDTGVFSQYYQLGNSLTSEFSGKLDQVGVDFKQPVLDCLRGKGYVGTGADLGSVESFGVKVGSLVGASSVPETRPESADGLIVEPSKPAQEYVPTAEETKFAVTLVRCRTETGMFAKVDEVANNAQQKIVEDHAVEFAELNPKMDIAAKEAAKVLGR